jgi:sigma-B regulation protein RsbU (phosphoserine phosphatase)
MRVLIADDDPISRRLLQRTLQQWGYEVTVARDGNEAWKLFEERDFPLVISDWVMPGLDGLELVRRIRACPRPGYVFIILLTANTRKREMVEGLAAGADDFVTKPFDHHELRVRLRGGERVLRLEQALLEQNRVLSERNTQMEADLRMACEVQQALLPQGYPSFPAHVPPERSALRFCDRYRPNGAVGGDFFDVLALSDTRAGLFICDVMGHGVRAALVTAMVRTLLETHRGIDDPGRFLTEMNRELLAILGQGNVPVFLSAFYGLIDTTSGDFCYANAGHPCPLHVRRGQGEVGPLVMAHGMPGPPLGVRDQAVYLATTTSMHPGDLLILFTDGVFEVTDTNGDPFGEERLQSSIRARMNLPAGRLFDEVLADVQAFSASRGFADDVCLVGMEFLAVNAGRAD